MNKLVKPVRELDAAARKKVEEGLGTPLADDSQIEFVPAETHRTHFAASEPPPLPDYYRVYDGLTDEEIDDLEKMILNRDDWD